MIYDPKDPRTRAAHDAGEKTYKLLNKLQPALSPTYIAMAVVQDALMAFLKKP